MSKFSVELKIGGNWTNGVTYVQQATIIVDGRTLKEVEEKAISMYCDDIIKQYGETNNLEAIYNNIDKTTEATCSTCGKCVCEWSITARAHRMKKDESYKYARNYSGVRYCYNGLYKGYTSEKICYIAFDPEYNKAQPTEATEITETQPTEATAQTTETTEATGKEVTGVTILEYRTYNNGDKVIIKHRYFYNADEIIDNYHATDPSYICKYKGLMFGKDDNDYYVSEFHYEEQYL